MSFRAGFLSLIPNVVPVLMNFGVMGLCGIPLNLTTAMVVTIAIGIAVDDTVHHMVVYSRELNAVYDEKRAIVHTLRSQGRPIISVSLALTAGFAVLICSNLVATRYFGALSAFVMLAVLVGELVLTPVLLYTTRLVAIWDMFLLKMNPAIVRTAPLFREFSQWEARKVVLMGTLQTLPPGTTIVHKGDTGTEMYMVVTGQARVFDTEAEGQERTLALLTPGATFGEMAWFGHGIRTANVVADTPTEVLALDFQALERLRRRFPYTGTKLFRNLARILSERLAQTNAALMHTPAFLAEPRAITTPPRPAAQDER